MCFVQFSKEAAIIFLHISNWLVFLMETKYVFRDAGSEFWNIYYVDEFQVTKGYSICICDISYNVWTEL
jgi:hypothetical protein